MVHILASRRRLLSAAILIGTGIGIARPALANRRGVVMSLPGFNCPKSEIASRFPHTSAVLTQDYARDLATALRKVNNQQLDYAQDQATRGGDGAVVAALVFDDETVFSEELGGVHKLTAIIAAQLLFFDFTDGLIVAAYPISEIFVDVSQSPPDAVMERAAVARLIYERVSARALAVAAAARIRPTDLKQEVGLGEILIADPARQAMPSALAAIGPRWIAQEFAKAVSQRHQLSVVPYVPRGAMIKDTAQAIAGQMALSVSSGDVFTLKIPSATYLFDVEFADVRRIEGEPVSGGTRFIYGTVANLTLREPVSGKRFFSGRVKNGESRLVPATQTTIADWPGYSDAIVGLFRKFADALGQPTAKWAETYAYDAAKVSELQEAGKVIAKCV